MSKASLAALAVSALTLCGTVFAAVQLSGLRNSVAGIEERVSRLETTATGRPPAAGIAPAELASLRAELDRLLKAQKETVVIPGDGAQGGLTAEDLARAMEEAFKLREKESRAKAIQNMMVRIREHTTGLEKSLSGALQLSEAESLKLRDILKEQLKAYQEAMESGLGSDEVGKKMMIANAEAEDRIRAMLGPEKQKNYDALPPAKRKWFGGMGSRRESDEPR